MSADAANVTTQQVIALVNMDAATAEIISSCNFEGRQLVSYKNGLQLVNAWESQKLNVAAIISRDEVLATSGITLIDSLYKKGLKKVPFFLIVNHMNRDLRRMSLNAGVADVFLLPLVKSSIETRVNFLIQHWTALTTKNKEKAGEAYKIPASKRAFDMLFSGMALLFLSPVFLLIYLLIKIESKGPAFYYSLRVGTGYKVFRFYKFRSMYVNADSRLKDLKHLNQYDTDAAAKEQPEAAQKPLLCDQCIGRGKCQFPVYADNISWCEKDYIFNKKTKAGSAFFKIKNDPRITRIGNFIRNTSIDELPQLWNVFTGDMSIVGNRPLPLYEAEKLTTDKYALRFHAPAGITGLWQVEKRGKGDMSEEERLMLDNVYAKNHSLRNDIKLILKTIPALLQKENV